MVKGFCPLASGSKGNALYVGGESTKILIDAGLSKKQIELKLREIGVSLEEIDAIVVTHEHIDHIRGIEVIAKHHDIPILANSDTARAISETMVTKPHFKIFTTGETFTFGDFDIHPFSIQHDTLDPVAFTIHHSGKKLGICADLGFVTTLVKAHLRDCDYLYLESNHEVSMVHASSRPPRYKQRVLGRQGHLSNDQSNALLTDLLHPALKNLYLAHLSEECNNPDLAHQKAEKILSQKNVHLEIAHQHSVSHFLEW